MRTILALSLCAAGTLLAQTKLGQPLALKQPVSISDVLAKPDSFVDKPVQVRGKVTEVCQMMGCWMALAEPGTDKVLRIKVKDGDIVFPKDSMGKMAVAEGTLQKIELTAQQAVARAQHEAEEQGRKFDPATVAKLPRVLYQIKGSGAVIE